MADDVIMLLTNDHRAAEALLKRFDDLPVDGREDYFYEVVQTLVGHEVAEEQVVYPVIREVGKDAGDQVADARLEEQSEAEQLLSDMESQDRTSTEFATSFEKLRRAVLAHAEAEESTAFTLLESGCRVDEREALGEEYLKAKDRAATHPHPHAPDTPPGNKVLGPVTAAFDRARDAVHH